MCRRVVGEVAAEGLVEAVLQPVSPNLALRERFRVEAFNLLPVLSAVENVEIPLLLLGATSREARLRALETLEQVGLAPRASHRPDQLSGGEQQRVAVARALVRRPAVVWADEPTGNLDSESTQAILDLFLRLNAEGQTIVMVTHNPQVAEAAARTIHMRDGMVVGGARELDRTGEVR